LLPKPRCHDWIFEVNYLHSAYRGYVKMEGLYEKVNCRSQSTAGLPMALNFLLGGMADSGPVNGRYPALSVYIVVHHTFRT
jgi:hypothetical protein